MAVWRSFLTLMTLAARAHPALVSPAARADDVTLSLEPLLTGGFDVVLIDSDDSRNVLAHIGRTLFSPYTMEQVEGGVDVQINNVNLTVRTLYDADADAKGIKISWHYPGHTRLEDCIAFGAKQWYAGPMQIDQLYPIQNAPRTYSAYVSSEIDNAAIVERYWLNSAGEYIYVHPDVPLFVDYNQLLTNHLCLGAQIDGPYSSRRQHTSLSYDIWILSDVKAAHKHAVANYLGKPSDVPDFRMVQYPIWSSWAQYSRDIDESNLIDFAQQIRQYGFNDSQFEVDDKWETCYGSLTVDTNKFPNFTHFVEEVKKLGYRVTLWVHPFINNDCDPWYSEALSKGYFVVTEEGNPNVTWWNSHGAQSGYIDFTNPAAAEWWYERILALRVNHGIDSFKFDAGESTYAPQIAVQTGDIDLQPHHIVDSYVRTCARFGDMIEIRAGFRTQDLPVWVRMVDRDSIWGTNNGLPTIVTTTLQMNLNGYPLVLPDMIGGNGYNLEHEQADMPTKELFIRWVEANAFLPVMQFSFAPWNFDDETVLISRKYAELHAEYAEKIFEAIQEAVDNGTPANGPLWWLDPTDETTFVIWDQYLVGEDIIVAPVLQEGQRSRDIYLPKGVWLEQGDPSLAHEGPVWLHSYPAPLDTLPFFVRDGESSPDGASGVVVSALVLVAGLVANALVLF